MNSNTVNSAAATADLAAGLRLAAPQSSAAPARMMSAVVQFWLTVPLTSLILANRGIGAGSIGLFAMLPWLAVLLLALEIAPAHGLPRGLARVTLVIVALPAIRRCRQHGALQALPPQ